MKTQHIWITTLVLLAFIVGRKTVPEKEIYVWPQEEIGFILTGLSTPPKPNPPLSMLREHESVEIRIGNTTKTPLIIQTARGAMTLKPGQGKIFASQNPADILIEEPEEVRAEKVGPHLKFAHF